MSRFATLVSPHLPPPRLLSAMRSVGLEQCTEMWQDCARVLTAMLSARDRSTGAQQPGYVCAHAGRRGKGPSSRSGWCVAMVLVSPLLLGYSLIHAVGLFRRRRRPRRHRLRRHRHASPCVLLAQLQTHPFTDVPTVPLTPLSPTRRGCTEQGRRSRACPHHPASERHPHTGWEILEVVVLPQHSA